MRNFLQALHLFVKSTVEYFRSGRRPIAPWTHPLFHSVITVLVVEDEPLIRMDICDQLNDLGFNVVEAANADTAIEKLNASADIQVIFTDIDMPGSMDGLKLASAVRDRWPPVRIIITSGQRSVVAADMPRDSRFFSKPYMAKAVAAAMREMIGP